VFRWGKYSENFKSKKVKRKKSEEVLAFFVLWGEKIRLIGLIGCLVEVVNNGLSGLSGFSLWL